MMSMPITFVLGHEVPVSSSPSVGSNVTEFKPSSYIALLGTNSCYTGPRHTRTHGLDNTCLTHIYPEFGGDVFFASHVSVSTRNLVGVPAHQEITINHCHRYSHLIDTDCPTRSTTVTTTTDIWKNIGDADMRGGNTRRVGKNTEIYRLWCMREVTTEVTSTMLQVSTIANTDPGITMTRYPFQIIL